MRSEIRRKKEVDVTWDLSGFNGWGACAGLGVPDARGLLKDQAPTHQGLVPVRRGHSSVHLPIEMRWWMTENAHKGLCYKSFVWRGALCPAVVGTGPGAWVWASPDSKWRSV